MHESQYRFFVIPKAFQQVPRRALFDPAALIGLMQGAVGGRIGQKPLLLDEGIISLFELGQMVGDKLEAWAAFAVLTAAWISSNKSASFVSQSCG